MDGVESPQVLQEQQSIPKRGGHSLLVKDILLQVIVWEYKEL
jgi:hypothetical protein